MASIDERIVSIAFDNAKFEANVAVTMATLSKLEASLGKIGTTNSLGEIEKSASKVTLEQPMSALDKLKARLTGAGSGAAEGFSDISKAASKVDVTGAATELDKIQAKSGQVGQGAAQGFSEISRAAGRVDVSGTTSALDSIQAKFSLIEGAAAVAFGNITSQAVSKGANFAKSFGVGPILDGLHEYETNLKSIQTVQANTDRPLTEINKSLEELNRYSDQTIYNFSEMARNIGTFTAAGVDLKTATSSIKGIANMAALSGSSSQQAATAMYQLSQAISSGRVGLQDWNSVVNAGMGGKKLQTALVTTGQAMGDVGKNALKFEGPMKKLTINGKSFRESIMAQPGQQSWLSSDILVNTLATLDGRFSKAALSAETTKNGLKKYTAAQVEASIADSRAALEKKNGVKYTDEQFKNLMKLSDASFKSATEVKTLGQVFDVARETIGSGWSASFQNIFGNLTEAKELFTGMSGSINGFINKMSLARNTLLAGWKEMGGREAVIQGLKNIFNVLGDVMSKVGKAFREIFPRKSSEDLVKMSNTFLVFTAHLNNSPQIIDSIARTFKGFFAVLHIGWSIIKGVVGVIGDLLGTVGKGSGGFLNFTGGIGDMLVALDKALTKGGLLEKFFKGLSGVLQLPLQLLGNVAGLISGLFGGGDAEGASTFAGSVDKVNTALTPAEKLLKNVTRAWEGFKAMLSDIREKVEPWLTQAAEKISDFAGMIADAIKNADWDSVFLALQTSFLGGLFLTVKKALGGGISDIGGGLQDSIKGVLGGVTDHLKAMQAEIKANVLLKIGAAIALLALSIGLLSLIPPDKLSKAMTAVAVGLGELMGAMAIMGNVGLSGGKIAVIAAGMVVIAAAILILAGAMKIMSTMDWEDLAKGLAGIAGALIAVGVGVKFIGPSIIPAALAMIPLAIGLNLLALAVKQFASMKWEDLGKGLLGVGAAMGMIALGMAALPVGQMVVVGAGLILVGIGLNLLSAAVLTFGNIPFEKMLIGLFGVAASLAAIGVAIMLIPPTVALQAAGLILVAIALQGIAAAIAVMGNLGIEVIIKGLTAIAGALLILAIGLTAMSGTLAGSAALLLAAIAFTMLAPAIALMGNLEWGTILKGLAAMALVIGVLAAVGMIAAPGLLQLALGIGALGLAMIPAAAAVWLFAKGLSLLAGEGQKGIAVFLTALTGFVALIPTLVINFVKGLVQIVEEIVKVAPQLLQALGVMIDMVIAFVIESSPKLAEAIGVLLGEFTVMIDRNAPKLIATGWKLIQSFLAGIDRNIGSVVSRVGSIITKFLDAMTQQAPRIIASGVKLLVSWLNGIANALPRVITAAANVALKFIHGITQQIPKFIEAGGKAIRTFLRGITEELPSTIKTGVRMVTTFMDGIGDAIPELVKAGLRVARKFLNSLAEGAAGLADAGFKAIIKFLNGIERAIRENDKELIEAGAQILDAIVDGVVEAAGVMAGPIKRAIEGLFGLLPGWAKDILGIHSPSTVFMDIGKQTMDGMVLGLKSANRDLQKAIVNPLAVVIHHSKEELKGFKQFLSKDFKMGIQGSVEDIRGAFQGLNQKIKDSMQGLKDTIAQDKDALKEALKPGGDQTEVNRTWAAIQANEALLKKARQAQKSMITGFKDEKKELIGLSKDFDTVTAMLEQAEAALADAVRTRDDALKSFTDQYSKLPDWRALVDAEMADAELSYSERAEKRRKAEEEAEKRKRIDQVALYKQALQEQIIATEKFRATLQKLRELGLDDATYQKLLSEGIEGQDFAEQLLAQGEAGIAEFNKMNAQLLSTSTELAKQASANLYQAGVDAAQGLVNGLKAKESEIRATMEAIAEEMVKAIKKKLKIKSPSQIFAEIGKFAGEGMAQGLTTSSTAIASAAESVGDKAVSAVQSSMNRISDVLSSEIDTDLKITPVLDLTQIQKDASTMQDLTNVTPITAASSYGLASGISADTAAKEAAQAADAASTHIELNQYNTSPKALDDVEIYRQTKNQLGQVKTALGVT